jgi:hypothetical protein
MIIYSLWFVDSQVTELQALTAAYVQAWEGQVNNGKCQECVLFIWDIWKCKFMNTLLVCHVSDHFLNNPIYMK